jgi:hypothetical protein
MRRLKEVRPSLARGVPSCNQKSASERREKLTAAARLEIRK